MKTAISALKAAFGIGKKPTQDDYANIFDSFVHIDSQAAVNGQIVDQKLNAYAQAQQQGNANGKVDTIGDMYAIFIGVDDRPGLIKNFILDKLSWSALPGRPSALDLTWTEQLITTDTSAFDPQPTQNPTSANTANNPATTFLLVGLGKLPQNGSYLIRDIQIRRQWTSQPNAYMDIITAVKVAYQPRATT